MLQEATDLQENAVQSLIDAIGSKDEVVFKSPTGSGKTHMMGDLMNRIIEDDDDVVFIVSSLSKSGLAEQNYDSFCQRKEDGTFPHLKPFLMSSECSSEDTPYIPRDRNVYVLPRDLNKKYGKIVGEFKAFLMEMTRDREKKIYLIKDECHIATNNLDADAEYFAKVIGMSATPKLRKGERPDVEITELEATASKLIKRVNFHTDYETKPLAKALDEALDVFAEMRKQYEQHLEGVKPCLIIQISNTGKAENELPIIKEAIENHGLIWAYMVDKDGTKSGSDTNDGGLKKLPASQWKKFAKKKTSPVDVIIFKMVISEGWDIPRACALFQVRDAKSKTLTEQVIGRVRRNPRLLDFEDLTEEAQELCLQAEVWGVPDKEQQKIVEVHRTKAGEAIKIKPTCLKPIQNTKAFSVSKVLESVPSKKHHASIFDLYKDKKKAKDIASEYRNYVDDAEKWFKFAENVGTLRQQAQDAEVDYEDSMFIPQEDGHDKEITLPETSYFTQQDDANRKIENWLWERADGKKSFSFDSLSEGEWADVLQDFVDLDLVKSVQTDNGKRYLIGKNYLMGSQIYFEYYSYGIRKSYPDFIMEDIKGRIHIFESKSLDGNSGNIDGEAYEQKIDDLEKCYKQASKLTDQHFYIPIKHDGTWTVRHIHDGVAEDKTKGQLLKFLMS